MSATINPMAVCRDCGKLFMKFSRDICPECREKEQSLVSRVVDHARMFPRSDVVEIARATGIAAGKIESMLHEGLLRRFGLKILYPCRICKSRITQGNLCFWCNEVLYRLLDELRGDVWGDPQVRQKIESAGLRPDLREEDWEKAAGLFTDNSYRRRAERNIVYRKSRSGNWYR